MILTVAIAHVIGVITVIEIAVSESAFAFAVFTKAIKLYTTRVIEKIVDKYSLTSFIHVTISEFISSNTMDFVILESSVVRVSICEPQSSWS